MIVLSNSAVEVIPVGGTVTLNLTVIHTGCDLNGCGGSEYHRQGSGAVRLRGRGNRCGQASIFDLSFNGNVTSGTAGTEVQLAMTIDGTIQDVQGMDMMINMIHHLAEAEKCCWEACYYKTVVKAMKEGDDREGRDEDEDDDEEWIEHDDMPNRNRTSSGRFRRGNTVGRRYPGNERRDWGGDMGSDGGTLQHGDMTTMTPDEQLNHLKTDVETMWRDATPEQRKRIKESLTKWSTTLTV